MIKAIKAQEAAIGLMKVRSEPIREGIKAKIIWMTGRERKSDGYMRILQDSSSQNINVPSE